MSLINFELSGSLSTNCSPTFPSISQVAVPFQTLTLLVYVSMVLLITCFISLITLLLARLLLFRWYYHFDNKLITLIDTWRDTKYSGIPCYCQFYNSKLAFAVCFISGTALYNCSRLCFISKHMFVNPSYTCLWCYKDRINIWFNNCNVYFEELQRW